jgi:hypothetical protein
MNKSVGDTDEYGFFLWRSAIATYLLGCISIIDWDISAFCPLAPPKLMRMTVILRFNTMVMINFPKMRLAFSHPYSSN